jgi:Fe-S cluster biogenesis protein NfuA
MFVATAAVAGTSLVVKSQPATFEEVAGVSSIDAGLASSGGEGNLVRITNGDGKIDLLYIGAPECGHCQNFMKNGFDDMVAQAEDRGLDFAYFPAAMTPVGVTIATLEACVVGDTSGAAKVKAAYGLNESVTAGAIAAQDLQKSGTPSAEISAYFTNLLETSQRAFGEEEVFDAQCYEREAAGMISRLNEVHRTFGLTGTPSFYFMDADGIMREQVGDYANAQMMSQVAPAK